MNISVMYVNGMWKNYIEHGKKEYKKSDPGAPITFTVMTSLDAFS